MVNLFKQFFGQDIFLSQQSSKEEAVCEHKPVIEVFSESHLVDAELPLRIQEITLSPAGWQAILLRNTDIDLDKWRGARAAQLIEHLFENTFPTLLKCTVFFMESGIVILLCKNTEKLDTQDLVKQFSDLIVTNAQGTETFHHIYRLEHVPDYSAFNTHYQQYRALIEQKRQQGASGTFELALDPEYPLQRQQRHELQVLIISDDSSTAQLLANVLGRQCRTLIARNTRELSLLYRAHVPHMVFLDAAFSDGHALEILKAIIFSDLEAFIILLAPKANKAEEQKAKAQGAEGYLSKPFTVENVGEYVQKCKKNFHLN